MGTHRKIFLRSVSPLLKSGVRAFDLSGRPCTLSVFRELVTALLTDFPCLKEEDVILRVLAGLPTAEFYLPRDSAIPDDYEQLIEPAGFVIE